MVKTKKKKKYDEFLSGQDALGSYTGNSTIQEAPEQDADDL